MPCSLYWADGNCAFDAIPARTTPHPKDPDDCNGQLRWLDVFSVDDRVYLADGTIGEACDHPEVAREPKDGSLAEDDLAG